MTDLTDPRLALADAPPLLLVGCGRMGSAMLAGWLAAGLLDAIVIEPSAQPGERDGVRYVPDVADMPTSAAPGIVVLAIKPQSADAVLPALGRFADAATYVSIMAGRTVAGIAAALGAPDAAIVRAMPNTPAAIGMGVTAAFAGPGVGPATVALCSRLLAAIGHVEWVADEALMDAVTAVSGSGPAYVFLLAELLEQAGIAAGLPAPLARALARRTVSGAGALLDASTEDAAALRQGVTSPAGTTAAALDVLMAPSAWPATLREAVQAAADRSRALAR